MQYKRINLKKYNLHIIKTKKFKTITIQINFKRKINKEELTKRRLLSYIFMESSKKYPSRRVIDMEIEELYGLSLYSDVYMSGNYDIVSLKETFLNEKYTESGMNKRSILFLLEILLNPDVNNGEFSDYGFDLAKRMVKSNIDTFSDYPTSYSRKRALEVMDKKSSISLRNCGYIKDLNKITKKELYNYYKDVIENDIIDIFVIGDINNAEIEELFKNNFTRKNDNVKSEKHDILIKKTNKEKIEKAKINQSHLVMGCSVDLLDDFEKNYVLNVYSFILGGSGDSLLFQKVREENSLCYHISSSYSIVVNYLSIYAGIDSKNYKKTVSLIKECMQNMIDGNFDDSEIEKAKTIYKNSLIELQDSQDSIIGNYLSHEYLNTDLIEDRMKKIDLVTKEMVQELGKRIHINITYLLDGGDTSEKV